ncbi:MAG: PIN domain-containing protein [Candidatus Bathyarchaeia archaeon]
MRYAEGSFWLSKRGALVKHIVKSALHRSKMVSFFEKASVGELYVSPITLSEALYIASRIYEMGDALDYTPWVKRRARMARVDEGIAIRAGELKKSLGISLPDCYVIARAEAVKTIPYQGHRGGGEAHPERLGGAF